MVDGALARYLLHQPVPTDFEATVGADKAAGEMLAIARPDSESLIYADRIPAVEPSGAVIGGPASFHAEFCSREAERFAAALAGSDRGSVIGSGPRRGHHDEAVQPAEQAEGAG